MTALLLPILAGSGCGTTSGDGIDGGEGRAFDERDGYGAARGEGACVFGKEGVDTWLRGGRVPVWEGGG